MDYDDLPEELKTEYDPTTSALLNTLEQYGLTNEQLEEDKTFLTMVMMTVGLVVPLPDPSHTTQVLDVCLLGLLYHRHMPFIHPDGTARRPERADDDYLGTLNALTAGILAAGDADISDLAAVAARVNHLLKPHINTDEGNEVLAQHMYTIATIGMIVHTLVPVTDDLPPA